MFLHHAVDCTATAKKAAIAFTITQFIHIHDIGQNENNRKPSNDGLRLFRLFHTGSAHGGSFRFPI